MYAYHIGHRDRNSRKGVARVTSKDCTSIGDMKKTVYLSDQDENRVPDVPEICRKATSRTLHPKTNPQTHAGLRISMH